ncbi:EamA family transporter [Pseudomonas sp. TE3610]
MPRLVDYFYIFATIGFTVYGQLALKLRISSHGAFPSDTEGKLKFLFLLFLDPIILSGFFAGFLASLTWMAAMTKFELSHAYPFMGLNFVVVILLSSWLLLEPLTFQRCLGVGLIVIGTVIAARG